MKTRIVNLLNITSAAMHNVSQKKQETILLPVSSQNADWISKFFLCQIYW